MLFDLVTAKMQAVSVRVKYLEVNSYLKISLFCVKGKNIHILASNSKGCIVIENSQHLTILIRLQKKSPCGAMNPGY